MIYNGIKALNWSSLKHLAVSPLLYRWRLVHPQQRKAAFVVGAAIHCSILEPEKFDSRYAIYEGTRRGKEWDAWQEDHPGVESLKPHEMLRVLTTAKTARAHRAVSAMLAHGLAEEIIQWVDAPTGLACKGRLDYLCPTVLLDLKSAKDIDPRNFRNACGRYLYHAQVAWYHDGAVVAGKLSTDGQNPLLVALQSAEPYDVAVYRLTAADLESGRAIYRHLLNKFVECTAADYWPGAVPDEAQLDAPAWSADLIPQAEEEEF